MGILQTAERSTHLDPSENVVFQRHLIAYKEAAKIISGTVLEIGSGEGFGISELAPFADRFVAVDKYEPPIAEEIKEKHNITFLKSEVPPLKEIDSESVDFVITFQVIEHIHDDEFFLSEIRRVLKPDGKLVITTPNSLMSLTRNPWHIREYTIKELKDLLLIDFSSVNSLGVFGNDKVMHYYQENKESVRRIIRFDIFNFQYNMPRWMLKIPYDLLNRLNRNNLLEKGVDIKMEDYYISSADKGCIDLFYISEK